MTKGTESKEKLMQDTDKNPSKKHDEKNKQDDRSKYTKKNTAINMYNDQTKWKQIKNIIRYERSILERKTFNGENTENEKTA